MKIHGNSKYGPNILKKSYQYLERCKDGYERIYQGLKDVKTKKKIYAYEHRVNFPTHEGLAIHLGITRRTLHNWSSDNKDFFHVLDRLNQEQVKRLFDMGLSGRYNATIAKLVLAKHGYKESTDSSVKILNISLVKILTDANQTGRTNDETVPTESDNVHKEDVEDYTTAS